MRRISFLIVPLLALDLLSVGIAPAVAQTVRTLEPAIPTLPGRRNEIVLPNRRNADPDSRRLNRTIRMQNYNDRRQQPAQSPSTSRPANARSPRSNLVINEQ